MSRIDEMAPAEVQVARENYLWDRQDDARQGIKDALLAAMRAARFGVDGPIDISAATLTMEAVLGAVVPERRCLIIITLVEAYERYRAIRDAGPARQEAWRPVGRLLADAAEAQIAGIVSLFGGGSR